MKNPIRPKDRMKIPRQVMPTQEADIRGHNFTEVSLGLPILSVQTEANRCLECSDPKCTHGCPVGVKIRDFIDLIREEKYLEAAAKIREDNVLPAITGRVCPQENQCEGACVLGNKFEPLGIGYLERFVADFEKASGKRILPIRKSPTGKKVAIVGSGPAGLSAAGDLVLEGHQVKIFEALHEPGGVLMYGIPEFRLPKQIVRDEIENLRELGIEFETNVVIGKTITIDELFEEEQFDAVFIATGAGYPKLLGIPGEHLAGVYSANEFLTRVNLMGADKFPEFDEPVYHCKDKVVAVIGAGNTAMDAARTALRLGTSRTLLIYRRTEAEMPARKEEIVHAKEEGIEFFTLTSPIKFAGNEQGVLTEIICQRMELGVVDHSGRRSPLPISNSEFSIPIDLAIIALGTKANPLIQSTTPDLATTHKGYIEVDPKTLSTSKPGVFAGGDIVTGGATVISAMGAGRKAAQSISSYLCDLS